ncbi:VanW family protein [Clostridium estertheticum]|uniref:VanW family protein n=1 Tax=Clostridium estertheticum TaxID=238834 RepID=UPI001CF0F936|nr:VanW family protein [Clostridium estertheticum]MCB2307461.1 VanW family protein [Clostridium estertheticum]MCB2345718.1 VanW family protein [Clostridium estertheticum]MCB2350950.1 VanW family protein [Clostridium estertheticum]WAG44068.1 VanW family protein [Clostridium estertheticum]
MRKSIKIMIILLLIVVLGTSGLYAYVNYNTKKWTSLVYPGVKIGELDISGKTLVQAKDTVTQKYQSTMLKKNVNIKTPQKTYSLNFAKMNAKYNVDEVVNEAFNYGKNLSLYGKYKLIRKSESKVFTMKFTYDSKPLTDLISNMKKEINSTPKNASIYMNGGTFIVTPDTKGSTLMDDKLKKEILTKINGDINSADISVSADIKTTLATATKEKLQTVNTKLSSFSSDFSTSSYGRSTNITLATESINGTILMPGESFSFNDTVGKRTADKGYQPAPVDIGTKVSSDYGGGICQVSTSLYNAILRSNINSTERNHHSIPSTYIPLGMDATVDWGNLDYKFTNTLGYPVFIEGIVNNKILTFNVYSNSSLANKSYTLVNDIYAAVQPGPTQYIDDATLPVGSIVQEQFPLIGYKVRTYKNTIQNGNVINHELISNDSYQLKAEVIRVGIKKVK